MHSQKTLCDLHLIHSRSIQRTPAHRKETKNRRPLTEHRSPWTKVTGVKPHAVKMLLLMLWDFIALLLRWRKKRRDGIIIFIATLSTPPTSIIKRRLHCLHVMPRAARQHPVGGRITSSTILHSNYRTHHPLLFAQLFVLHVTGHTEKCFLILKNLPTTSLVVNQDAKISIFWL